MILFFFLFSPGIYALILFILDRACWRWTELKWLYTIRCHSLRWIRYQTQATMSPCHNDLIWTAVSALANVLHTDSLNSDSLKE